jgi:hypothetical protein
MNSMNKSYKLMISIAMILALITVLVTGCNQLQPTSETGVISEITMSTGVSDDSRPINPTTVFSADAVGFYCSFKLSGFPVGAKVEVQWIYVGGDPATEVVTGKNYVCETQTAIISKKGQGYTYTNFMGPGITGYKWPIGDYKVLISVDGLEKGSTYFKVQ